MLSQIVYVSVRKPNCTEAEIEKILDSCKKNNGQVDITGVLLYSETQFIQYLEGAYREIIGLYDKIKLDDRHKNISLIASAPIKVRTFPSWQMGVKKFDTQSIEFKTDIDHSGKELFNAILSGKNQEPDKAVALIKKFFK
jgi:hypothetical protein